jgi:hypothetical protein
MIRELKAWSSKVKMTWFSIVFCFLGPCNAFVTVHYGFLYVVILFFYSLFLVKNGDDIFQDFDFQIA